MSPGERALTPDEALARARARRQAGDSPGAAAICAQILRLAPDHAATLDELGLILFQQDRPAEALALFRRAAARAPGNAEIQIHLGIALERQGHMGASEAAYRLALRLEPGSALAHYNLGHLLQAQDRLDDAAAAYRCALTLRSRFGAAQNNLAAVLQRQGRLAEAEAAYRAALALGPDEADAHHNLGCVLGLQGHHRAAEASYRRALELRPDSGPTALNLAVLLRETGRATEAERHAEHAARLLPDDLEAICSLALCRRAQPGDPLLARIEALLAEVPRSAEKDRRLLYSTLGKLYEDLARYGDAFEAYRQANESSGRAGAFDAAGFRSRIAALMRTSMEARPALPPDTALAGRMPVFVVGLSRSGKTLAESLLAEPGVVGLRGEADNLETVIASVRAPESRADDPGDVARLRDEQLAAVRRIYLGQMVAGAPGCRWLVSTVPGHFAYLGLVFTLFPGALVIHCARDPRDHCLAMYFKQYARGHEHTRRLDDLVTYYRGYAELMAHWRRLHGGHILEVRYEDIVQEPQATARRLRGHLGLDGEPAAVPVFTADEIGRWRRYAPYIRPLLDAFGASD